MSKQRWFIKVAMALLSNDATLKRPKLTSVPPTTQNLKVFAIRFAIDGGSAFRFWVGFSRLG